MHHALSGRYSALLLDVMLPDLSGTEVLRQVRQRSRLPIIMLTAKGTTWIEWWDWRWGPMTMCPNPCYPRGAGGPAAGRSAAGQRGGSATPSPDALILGI